MKRYPCIPFAVGVVVVVVVIVVVVFVVVVVIVLIKNRRPMMRMTKMSPLRTDFFLRNIYIHTYKYITTAAIADVSLM